MITLFALPRRFEGEAAVHQRQALASWASLGPEVEVLLIGNDHGIAEAAAQTGVRHELEVATNEFGTPLLDSAFAIARDASERRLLAYVNADIVLRADFIRTIRRIRFRRFLCMGRRRESSGQLAPPDAIDYFVFDRTGPLTDLPPFAVGRPGWDNWMIYRARSLGVPVIDASRTITALHPQHSYNHVPRRTGYRWYGPEADANFALIKGLERFQTRHATHVITAFGVFPALTPRRILSRIRSRHAVNGGVERIARAVEALLRSSS
jgi:hypothetical protein